MRLAIIGGGGFRVPLVYRALRQTTALPGGPGRASGPAGAAALRKITEVVLYDPDHARSGVIAEVLRQEGDGPPVRLAADLDSAVRDAGFVFSAIRVGGTAARARDERLALAEGVIGQETVGAGGVLYGLRSVPVALDLAERVRRLAPDAWVINFTNPAGMVTEAMSAILGHRVIGICDSPSALVRRTARAAGVDERDVTPDYLGLNHLGWLRGLTHQGRDLLPGLLADDAALATIEEGRLFGGPWLRGLGQLPNEYLHYYYFRREALEQEWEATETRGEFLDRQQREFFLRAAEEPARARELWEATRLEREETYLAGAREAAGAGERDPEDLEGGGYEHVALALMHAITEDQRTRLIVNVRNAGLVPALPDHAIIETVCEVGADGAHPVPGGTPGAAELGLMLQVKASEWATIEAARTGSDQTAVRALALHPLVDSPAVAARVLQRYRSA